MDISLTPQLESIVRSKVKTGLYNSASEVIREALRMMEQVTQMRKNSVDLLDKKTQNQLSSPYTKEEIQEISAGISQSEFYSEEISDIQDFHLLSEKSFSFWDNKSDNIYSTCDEI